MTSVVVPDAIEPLVGWRYWNVDEAGTLVSTVIAGSRWVPNEAKAASCLPPANQLIRPVKKNNHAPPHARCSCGIYAAKDLDTLREAVRFLHLERLVVGEVKLWGTLIPAQRGYRAQFAYPASLFVVADTFGAKQRPTDIAAELERSYGVEAGVMSLEESRPHRYSGPPVLDPRRVARRILAAWALLALGLTLVRVIAEVVVG